MATAPIHGKNARIQIDAAAITNANAWTLTLGVQTVEATQFATATETHVRNMPGLKADSGTITAWQPIDAKVLQDQRGSDGRLWIYPDYTTSPTCYWYGVVLFTEFGSDSSTTSAVGATLNFINGNTDAVGMAAYGFA